MGWTNLVRAVEVAWNGRNEKRVRRSSFTDNENDSVDGWASG